MWQAKNDIFHFDSYSHFLDQIALFECSGGYCQVSCLKNGQNHAKIAQSALRWALWRNFCQFRADPALESAPKQKF
jgi:hypothetical protein